MGAPAPVCFIDCVSCESDEAQPATLLPAFIISNQAWVATVFMLNWAVPKMLSP